jgi:ribosomal protein L16/L10AE
MKLSIIVEIAAIAANKAAKEKGKITVMIFPFSCYSG